MVGGLLLEVDWGRERAFISWTAGRESASSFYGNVGEGKNWISWSCCTP